MDKNEEKLQQKYRMMTTTKVEKLVLRMAGPSIISMLVSTIYNMVDTMFVGRISTEATAGVGIVFTFQALIQAVGFFLGFGSGNYISRALGRKETENAQEMAATGFFTGLIVGFVFLIVGFAFMNPILRFLGATDYIIEESRAYMAYILIGAPFMVCSFVLNLQMRLQGNASISMFGISAGAILNCFLDPLFIFTFGMGVGGAALATSVSQFVSFSLLLYLSGLPGGTKICFSKFKPHVWHYKEIVEGGLPSLARQSLASVANVCMNRIAGPYGTAVIAAFSVAQKAVMFAFSLLLGFGQGFQPVSGFNYGAGKYERVKDAFWFAVAVGTVYTTLYGLVFYFFAPQVISFFRNDPDVIYYGSKILRYQSFAAPLHAYSTMSNMYLQTTKKTIPASILAMARNGIVYLPVLFLLNRTIGLNGALSAQAVSDVITFLISIPLCTYHMNRMIAGKDVDYSGK